MPAVLRLVICAWPASLPAIKAIEFLPAPGVLHLAALNSVGPLFPPVPLKSSQSVAAALLNPTCTFPNLALMVPSEPPSAELSADCVLNAAKENPGPARGLVPSAVQLAFPVK